MPRFLSLLSAMLITTAIFTSACLPQDRGAALAALRTPALFQVSDAPSFDTMVALNPFVPSI